jgi:CBS domain-containing protein
VKLIDLLAPDRVVLGTAGETVHDVARSLMHAVIASGQVQDADRLEALLAETLPGEAVTVGQRAFLLHFRTDAVERVTGALAVAAAPVHRAHDASKEARVVTLLLAPPGGGPGEGTAYLRALAAFARALSREEVVAALEHAGSAEELLAAPELAAVEVPDELLVRDILSGRVVSVTPETSLLQAARLMLRNGVAALPVVSEEQEVLGLISHGEILRHLLARSADRGTSGEHQAGARPSLTAAREHAVRDVMDRSVLCLSEEQSVIEAATLMVNKKLERVPVVREGALIGLLTREDLVRRLFGP